MSARPRLDIVIGGAHHRRHLRARRARPEPPVRPDARAQRGPRRVPDAGRLSRPTPCTSRSGMNPLLTAPGHRTRGLRRRPAPAPPLYARVLARARGAPGPSSPARSSLSFGAALRAQNAGPAPVERRPPRLRLSLDPVRMLGAAFPANRVVGGGDGAGPGPRLLRLPAAHAGRQGGARAHAGPRRRAAGRDRRPTACTPSASGSALAMSAVTGSLVSMFFELTPFMGLPLHRDRARRHHPRRPRQRAGQRGRRARSSGVVETASVYCHASTSGPSCPTGCSR